MVTYNAYYYGRRRHGSALWSHINVKVTRRTRPFLGPIRFYDENFQNVKNPLSETSRGPPRDTTTNNRFSLLPPHRGPCVFFFSSRARNTILPYFLIFFFLYTRNYKVVIQRRRSIQYNNYNNTTLQLRFGCLRTQRSTPAHHRYYIRIIGYNDNNILPTVE